VTVRALDPADVRPMRSLVLRPGQPPQNLVYDGDDHPQALHAGAFDGDLLVSIATVYPEAPPDALRGPLPEAAYAEGASFRLRGMATLPERQGGGYGRATLKAACAHVREAGARYLWCNARVTALGFYERLGFEAVGEEFEIAGIGPHYVMWLDCAPER
jgi:GNAT superfamily N-acetyltransferase